jgi:hypothetical protein
MAQKILRHFYARFSMKTGFSTASTFEFTGPARLFRAGPAE